MTKPLTERDWEVLETLHYMRYESSMREHYEHGTAPLDFGGSNGSHHGATATKLAKLGLVEHRKRGYEWGQAPTRYRGSKLYRISEAGRKLVEDRRRGEK